MIYFDYSAHTSPDPRVLARFCEAAELRGNANSRHAEGARARELVDQSVKQIANLLGAEADEVIMTSGATEANNAAIKGALRMRRHFGKHAVISCLEHASVSGPLTAMQAEGWTVDVIGIDRDGRVRLDDLRDALTEQTTLVSVCLVDSELGAIQPIGEISELVHRLPKCLLHVDATQAVGKIPVKFGSADLMSLSAHKFYGINGSGALLRKKDAVIEPLLSGGSGASAFRAGTPAHELTAATAEALQISIDSLEERHARVSSLNRRLRDAITRIDGVWINSPEDAIPHILNIGVRGIKADDAVVHLSDAGICLSARSACSVLGTPSRPVMEIYKDRKRALSAFRVSLSHKTTDEELNTLIEKITEMKKWIASAK